MWNFLHARINYNNEKIVIKDLPKIVLSPLLALFICEKISGYHTAFILEEIRPMLSKISD